MTQRTLELKVLREEHEALQTERSRLTMENFTLRAENIALTNRVLELEAQIEHDSRIRAQREAA